MKKAKETDYQFLCRQVDKAIELLQDLKSVTVIPCATWDKEEKEKGYTCKNKIKRVRRQVNDWLTQVEKSNYELELLGLIENETIN